MSRTWSPGSVPHPTVDEGTGRGAGPEGFEIGGLLGRGGMGEVWFARDRRLGRDVALKTPRGGDAEAAARLEREAGITARLEHPNIVPVYSAGRDGAGRPWYVMRLLPGRSLAEAVGAAPTWAERAGLLRHVLDAAEAVAYAHGRGVLHRDLKPANVMVGTFGETVVGDWGLAATPREASAARGAVGTPGYMSPEQAAGEPVDFRTDVYGLGAVLYEVCTGKAPPSTGIAPPVASVVREVPAELAAIVDRALAPDPADRYPGARALADDLLAYFEGRRVAAHTYTAGEVLRRAWASWRAPILVGGVGLLALALAVGVGWTRTAAERERARASEARAVAAQEAEREALVAALVAQAHAAAEADLPLEAEVLAVNALARRESPEARGILARFGRPRAALLQRTALPRPCARAVLAPAVDRVSCLVDGAAEVLDLANPGSPVARLPGPWSAVALTGERHRAALVDDAGALWTWTPPEPPVRQPSPAFLSPHFGETERPGSVPLGSWGTVGVVDAATGAWSGDRICGPGTGMVPAFVDAEGALWAGCADQRLLRRAPDGAVSEVATIPEDAGLAYLVTRAPGGRILVGTVSGHVLVFDGPRLVSRRRVDGEAILSAAVSGSRVAVATAAGTVAVWDPDADALLARLRPGVVSVG